MKKENNTINLTVLVDNHAQKGLIAEHGYALWIEAEDKRIMFDTGNKDAFIVNSNELKCDLSAVTDLVISHGHYDHTGGVETVLTRAKGAEVYLHQGAFQPRYVQDKGSARAIRVPGNSLKALDRFEDTRVHWATKPMKITESIGLTGPIPRNNKYEDVGGAFYLDQECTRPDLIEDDIALWFQSPQGLVVCVGCSHAGIVNTLEKVMDVTGETRIHTVIGGMHLRSASKERLQYTVSSMNKMDITQVIPCHCTGDEATDYLEKNLNCKVTKGYAGLTVSI